MERRRKGRALRFDICGLPIQDACIYGFKREPKCKIISRMCLVWDEVIFLAVPTRNYGNVIQMTACDRTQYLTPYGILDTVLSIILDTHRASRRRKSHPEQNFIT